MRKPYYEKNNDDRGYTTRLLSVPVPFVERQRVWLMLRTRTLWFGFEGEIEANRRSWYVEFSMRNVVSK